MALRNWRDTPRTTQYQTYAGVSYKQANDGTWRIWDEAAQEWRRSNRPELAIVPRPIYVGQHRGTRQFQLTAVGGPWNGQRIILPEPSGSPHGLSIRVGQFYGRYNLSTGEWQDLHEETTP